MPQPSPSSDVRTSIIDKATEALCREVVHDYAEMSPADQERFRYMWRESTKRILKAALLED